MKITQLIIFLPEEDNEYVRDTLISEGCKEIYWKVHGPRVWSKETNNPFETAVNIQARVENELNEAGIYDELPTMDFVFFEITTTHEEDTVATLKAIDVKAHINLSEEALCELEYAYQSLKSLDKKLARVFARAKKEDDGATMNEISKIRGVIDMEKRSIRKVLLTAGVEISHLEK